jgi:hypothetical protein
MSEQWTLREHAEAVIEATHLDDPRDIARKVILSIPDEHMRQALDESVPGFVTALITRSRWAPEPDDTTSGHVANDTHGAATAGGEPSTGPGQGFCDTQKRPAGSGNYSAKWQGVSDHKKILRSRMKGDGVWRRFANMTAADCRAAAADRRARADSMIHNAEKLEKLAALCDEFAVVTVGELPADVLDEVFDR